MAELAYAHDLRSCSERNVGSMPTSGTLKRKTVNENFFKIWTHEMSYVLGYVAADGCIFKDKTRENSWVFTITSKDKSHLYKIKKVLSSEYKISQKPNGTGGIAYHIQIRNNTLCKDLLNLGITPKKTYDLKPLLIPTKFLSDFVRGFFDGDGSVYIYEVNNTPQIKLGFVSVSLPFIKDLNDKLCKKLKIPLKIIHSYEMSGRATKYTVDFYVDDSKKFYKYIYGNEPTIYLSRKRKIFEKWNRINRRSYSKKSYPSKIGWHLNSSNVEITK